MVHHPQGYGLGNVGQTASRTNTPIKAGESNYTELGVELGVLGALLWIAWGLDAPRRARARAGRVPRARRGLRGGPRARDPDRRDRRPVDRVLRVGARRRARCCKTRPQERLADGRRACLRSSPMTTRARARPRRRSRSWSSRSCCIVHRGPRRQSGRRSRRATPGVLNPDVTQANIGSTICVRGWTRTVRPPVDYTNALKLKQMRAYGEPGPLVGLPGGPPDQPRARRRPDRPAQPLAGAVSARVRRSTRSRTSSTPRSAAGS